MKHWNENIGGGELPEWFFDAPLPLDADNGAAELDGRPDFQGADMDQVEACLRAYNQSGVLRLARRLYGARLETVLRQAHRDAAEGGSVDPIESIRFCHLATIEDLSLQIECVMGKVDSLWAQLIRAQVLEACELLLDAALGRCESSIQSGLFDSWPSHARDDRGAEAPAVACLPSPASSPGVSGEAALAASRQAAFDSFVRQVGRKVTSVEFFRAAGCSKTVFYKWRNGERVSEGVEQAFNDLLTMEDARSKLDRQQKRRVG